MPLLVFAFLFSIPYDVSTNIIMLDLQPLLQELGKQNPQILQLIQDNQDEFLRLINEPAEGDEGYDFSAFRC